MLFPPLKCHLSLYTKSFIMQLIYVINANHHLLCKTENRLGFCSCQAAPLKCSSRKAFCATVFDDMLASSLVVWEYLWINRGRYNCWRLTVLKLWRFFFSLCTGWFCNVNYMNHSFLHSVCWLFGWLFFLCYRCIFLSFWDVSILVFPIMEIYVDAVMPEINWALK